MFPLQVASSACRPRISFYPQPKRSAAPPPFALTSASRSAQTSVSVAPTPTIQYFPPGRAKTRRDQLQDDAMDQMMGNGNRFPLEQWFWEMPLCTRWWTTATFAISVMVQCQIITPFQLFYSYRSVFIKGQVSSPPPSSASFLFVRRLIHA